MDAEIMAVLAFVIGKAANGVTYNGKHTDFAREGMYIYNFKTKRYYHVGNDNLYDMKNDKFYHIGTNYVYDYSSYATLSFYKNNDSITFYHNENFYRFTYD